VILIAVVIAFSPGIWIWIWIALVTSTAAESAEGIFFLMTFSLVISISSPVTFLLVILTFAVATVILTVTLFVSLVTLTFSMEEILIESGHDPKGIEWLVSSEEEIWNLKMLIVSENDASLAEIETVNGHDDALVMETENENQNQSANHHGVANVKGVLSEPWTLVAAPVL